MPDFIIATTPRSGSTLLCGLLRATGRLGKPAEFFNPDYLKGKHLRLQELEANRQTSFADYLARLREINTTPNGVFGAKLLYFQFHRLYPLPAFRAYLQGARVIFLERGDAIAQALSLLHSLSSGAWTAKKEEATPGATEVPLDLERWRECFSRIALHNALWKRYLLQEGIDHLHVRYEEVTQDAGAAVRRIAAFVGVALEAGAPLGAVSMKQQSQSAKAAQLETLLRRLHDVKASADADVADLGGGYFLRG